MTIKRFGVVFDIDELSDPLYGFAAYRLLFKTVLTANPQLLRNCRLWDGDTAATLAGAARAYVIAIEADDAVLSAIRDAVSRSGHPALRPGQDRFLADEMLANEPLVVAARINELGVLDWCEASFVHNAWEVERRALQTPSGLQLNGDGKQRTPS